MPFDGLSEGQRRALERLEWWRAAIRSCAIGLFIIVGVGGLIAAGPLLLRAAS